MENPPGENMTPELEEGRKRANNWFGGRIFGALLPNGWNWMATLFALVSIGIAATEWIDSKPVPDPGKISIIWAPVIVLGTVGLNAVKEFYERNAQRNAENEIAELRTENGALKTRIKIYEERDA